MTQQDRAAQQYRRTRCESTRALEMSDFGFSVNFGS